MNTRVRAAIAAGAALLAGTAAVVTTQQSNPSTPTYVGTPLAQADRFNVIAIGADTRIEIDLRFRARYSGPLRGAQTFYIDRGYTGPTLGCPAYWVASTGYSNYACGNGGTIVMALYADVNGEPGGPALAETTWVPYPHGNGCATPGPYVGATCTPAAGQDRLSNVYKRLDFGADATTVAGTVYHLVWRNDSPDPTRNFTSMDWLGFRNKDRNPDAQDTEAVPTSDWRVGIRTANVADPAKCWTTTAWRYGPSPLYPPPAQCSASSHNESYSPPVALIWADGRTQGHAYYETHGYYSAWYLCGGVPEGCYANPQTLLTNPTQVIRQVSTWPRNGAATRLKAYVNMGLPISGTLELTLRCLQPGGCGPVPKDGVLARGTVPVAAYGQQPKSPNTDRGVNPNFVTVAVTKVDMQAGWAYAFEYRAATITGAVASPEQAKEGVDVPAMVDGADGPDGEGFWHGADLHDQGHAQWCPNGPLSACSAIGGGKRDLYFLVLTDEAGTPPPEPATTTLAPTTSTTSTTSTSTTTSTTTSTSTTTTSTTTTTRPATGTSVFFLRCTKTATKVTCTS